MSLHYCWIADISFQSMQWRLLTLDGAKLRMNCGKLLQRLFFLGTIYFLFFIFLQMCDTWALRPLTPIGALELLLPGWTRNKNRICPLDKCQSSSHQPPSWVFFFYFLFADCTSGGHWLSPKHNLTFKVRWRFRFRANQGTMMGHIFIREDGIATNYMAKWNERGYLVRYLSSRSSQFGSSAESSSIIMETWAQ